MDLHRFQVGVDSLLKDRKEWLAEKKEESKKEPEAKSAAGGGGDGSPGATARSS